MSEDNWLIKKSNKELLETYYNCEDAARKCGSYIPQAKINAEQIRDEVLYEILSRMKDEKNT